MVARGDSMRMRGVLIGLLYLITLCGVVLVLTDHKNAPLDFIEKYFHISPDGGDGSFEIILLVASATIASAIGLSLRSPVK